MVQSDSEFSELKAQVNALTTEVARLRNLAAIQRLIYDYAHYHDRGMSDAVADLFTDDATLEITGFGEALNTALHGREVIRAMYIRLDAQWGGPPPSRHVMTNSRIQIDGNEAVVITYFRVDGVVREEDVPPGLYHERVRLEADGQWRFAHKRIVGVGEQTVEAAISGKV